MKKTCLGLSLAIIRFHPNNAVTVFIQLVQLRIGVEISSTACFKLGFAISAVREVLILSGAGFAAPVVWTVAWGWCLEISRLHAQHK
jgi:hypothetical protein